MMLLDCKNNQLFVTDFNSLLANIILRLLYVNEHAVPQIVRTDRIDPLWIFVPFQKQPSTEHYHSFFIICFPEQ